MPVYASFEFFISSDVLLSSFHFTLLYVRLCHLLPLSFHVRYFHVLPLSVHILSLSLHAMHKISQTFPFVLSCPSDFPVISLSVRLIFFLIFLSCPFHFTLLSLQFPSLFPSSHSIFLVCPIIWKNNTYQISAHIRFKLCSWSLLLFMIFHALLCFFSVLYFLSRSIFSWTTDTTNVQGNFWIFSLWDLLEKTGVGNVWHVLIWTS